jgi:hypothetical protein
VCCRPTKIAEFGVIKVDILRLPSGLPAFAVAIGCYPIVEYFIRNAPDIVIAVFFNIKLDPRCIFGPDYTDKRTLR